MTSPVIVTLRGGRRALGKMYKGAPSLMTYANRTQAGNAAANLRASGVPCFVSFQHPFLVILDAVPA